MRDKSKCYHVHLSPEDYARFKHHKATRLYDHRYLRGELTIWSSKPYELAKDLQLVIDAGASSWTEILELPPRFK